MIRFFRVVDERAPLGNSWSYSYDAHGDRIVLTDANRATTNYTCDALRRLVAIDYPGSGDDVSFSYNAVGQRTSMQDGLVYPDGRSVAVVVGWGFPTSFSVKPDMKVIESRIEPDSETLRWI